MTRSPLAWALLLLVRAYRRVISPALVARNGQSCRFEPSCSAYAEEALATHGAVRGGWLTLRRLAKCQPWGPVGDDPVPSRHHRHELTAALAAGQE